MATAEAGASQRQSFNKRLRDASAAGGFSQEAMSARRTVSKTTAAALDHAELDMEG